MVTTSKREIGVLKLIHPGKHIETYTKPIPAAQVLDKYPRYCITRPDVFKFPWIIVKSDAILVPGKVFLLVPKRTIYQLLKSRQHHDHDPSSPSKSNAGMTPKRRIRSPRSSNRAEQDPARRRSRKSSQIESWPQVMSKNKSVKYSQRFGGEVRRPKEAGSDGGVRRREAAAALKSCMRKPESGRRLVNGRVRFWIPGEEESESKRRTVRDSLSRFAALLMVDICR